MLKKATDRLGEPQTNRELFDLLQRRGYLTAELATALGNTAGFRNILVHGYAKIDFEIVRDILAHRLDDLLAFVAAVRAIVTRSSDR